MNKFLQVRLVNVLIICFFLILPLTTIAEDAKFYENQINKLRSESSEKTKAINEAKAKQKEYKKILEAKRNEKATLTGKKEEIETQILEIKFNIIEIENSIEKNELEIKALDLEIDQAQRIIAEQKIKIGELIKLIYKNDSKGILEAFFLNDSLSDFFDQIQYTEAVQNGLANTLESYELRKQDLNIKKSLVRDLSLELEKDKEDLKNKNEDLANEQKRLAKLIVDTNNQEERYQDILARAIREQIAAQNEMKQIEKEILNNSIKFKDAKKKEELEKKLLDMGGSVSNNSLNWPVTFTQITSYFHDSSYPYKRLIGEHSGVDIRAKQGTAIKAPAAGYVLKVKDNGYGYNYIMLMHSNGVSTVYGHVSGFNVMEDQYVKSGDIIGYTGGTPGTKGAGEFSTGAHLHFEVRVSGIPVNPLEYLKVKGVVK